MGVPANPNNIVTVRQALGAKFHEEGIAITPQGLDALAEMFVRVPSEILGDTDALLLGLLASGSYTLDVLEDAGAHVSVLRSQAQQSTRYAVYEVEDPLHEFFRSDFMRNVLHNHDRETVLETSDILIAAIKPTPADGSYVDFPLELRMDQPPRSDLIRELEAGVCFIISDQISDAVRKVPAKILRTRTTPLTKLEAARVTANFGELEGDFAVRAIDEWLRHRRILTDPAPLCMQTIQQAFDLLYGPSFFADSGADAKYVEAQLQFAGRCSPERDLPQCVLLPEGDRIRLGEYTYRNAFQVDEPGQYGSLGKYVRLQAIRPVSLISQQVIREFEQLISSSSVSELDIQRFLVSHPELLLALGFTTAMPHIRLTVAGTQKTCVPDFLLEVPGSKDLVILDLKMPTARLSVADPYLRASHEVMKAVGQLRAYQNIFEDKGRRDWFHTTYGMRAFKPEIAVVMGRSSEFSSIEERKTVEAQVQGIKIYTYDDVLAYANERTLIL